MHQSLTIQQLANSTINYLSKKRVTLIRNNSIKPRRVVRRSSCDASRTTLHALHANYISFVPLHLICYNSPLGVGMAQIKFKRQITTLLFGCLMLFMLISCQQAAVEQIALSQVESVKPSPTATILPTATAPLPPPRLEFTPLATATNPPALVLPNVEDLASATPPPSPTTPPTATITPTPQPTFTPPALPGTSPNEHYWFWRPVPEDGVIWTDKIYPYGSTRNGTLRTHHGVEFNVSNGTPIYAVAAGTVVVAGDDLSDVHGEHANFYGNLVVIEHESTYQGQSVFTLYAHLSQVQVGVGQQVEARQQIALSGGTGVADGPHLHFEVRLGSNHYNSTRNPSLWIYPFNEYGTVAGRVTRPDGSLVEEVLVTITRIDAASTYRATTTYADGAINMDSGWRENFVLDDIPVGYYRVNAKIAGRNHFVDTWVYEYQTIFVEIVIDNSAE